MKSVMDEEQIAKLIQKLYFYKKLEDLNFEELKKEFRSVSDNYKTSNSNNLANIYHDYDNKLQMRREYLENSIFIYQKNLENYHQTASDNRESFDKDIIKGA